MLLYKFRLTFNRSSTDCNFPLNVENNYLLHFNISSVPDAG